jgi:hypothetical protein
MPSSLRSVGRVSDRAPGDDVAAPRAATAAVVVLAAVVGILLVTLGPDRSGSSDAGSIVAAATPVTTGAAPVSTTVPVTTTTAKATANAAASSTPAPTTTTVDAGTLPQTDDKPTATGAQFDTGAQGLWQAIVKDDPSLARPFFFPLSAYLQVKAISDPTGDYQSRLIANYEQDIHTLHAQLGDAASRAQLTGLSVPNDQAQWIAPGVEYNKGSYWRVYGSTLDYTVDGQPHSLPVTSLISWRGQWYVVHLGQIR